MTALNNNADSNLQIDVNTSSVSLSDSSSHSSLNLNDPPGKAKRVIFFINGNHFFRGKTIPVSTQKYRSFDSLLEDLTKIMAASNLVTAPICTIYTMSGRCITNINDLEDGVCYVCAINKQKFKKVNYDLKTPILPIKNQNLKKKNVNDSIESYNNYVYPRIVLLIRNGSKPRKIVRQLLNKHNSSTFEHVLQLINNVIKLNTGYVRKVFTLNGKPVVHLPDFFIAGDAFFVYGAERVNYATDFELDSVELDKIKSMRKKIRKFGTPYQVTMNRILDVSETNTKVWPSILRGSYTIEGLLGEGGFGFVYKIIDCQTSLPYALKFVDKTTRDGYAEVYLMGQLQHPNILTLLLALEKKNTIYMLLEYEPHGDLHCLLMVRKSLSENIIRIIMQQLSSALAYIHSKQIVHRDIKPSNILIKLDDDDNIINIKLADFGIACLCNDLIYIKRGTPAFLAPEIVLGKGYNFKVDVWSAGIMLYIMLVGSTPFSFQTHEDENMFNTITSGQFPALDDTKSIGVKHLLTSMLQTDPLLRLSSEGVLQHFWVAEPKYN